MRSSEIYAHYRDEMEAFAWNQLDRRNVDDRLRIIYKRFVVESSLNTERVRALYDICHAYLITTKLTNMKYVQVIGENGTVTQRIPYTENGGPGLPVCEDRPDRLGRKRRTALCGFHSL